MKDVHICMCHYDFMLQSCDITIKLALYLRVRDYEDRLALLSTPTKLSLIKRDLAVKRWPRPFHLPNALMMVIHCAV